ncbi:hypothetical protein GGE12_004234 [Rhizobium mongolense]|uniref:Uncharacterized protein n=1 Tax=Rhizobium mongolense TaxID=57676 RepID=A0A7W6RQ75_9HYPH|nr:hypothetical protein [Rhizobium mongolense]
MRILLLCHSFNSLSQRLHGDLRRAGHDVSVELATHDDLTREAIALFSPRSDDSAVPQAQAADSGGFLAQDALPDRPPRHPGRTVSVDARTD